MRPHRSGLEPGLPTPFSSSNIVRPPLLFSPGARRACLFVSSYTARHLSFPAEKITTKRFCGGHCQVVRLGGFRPSPHELDIAGPTTQPSRFNGLPASGDFLGIGLSDCCQERLLFEPVRYTTGTLPTKRRGHYTVCSQRRPAEKHASRLRSVCRSTASARRSRYVSAEWLHVTPGPGNTGV